MQRYSASNRRSKQTRSSASRSELETPETPSYKKSYRNIMKKRESIVPSWISNFAGFSLGDHVEDTDSIMIPLASDDHRLSTHDNGEETTPEEVTQLITHAKQVASKLQLLVDQSHSSFSNFVVEGQEPPSYDELLHKLSVVLSHQHKVNQATSQMTSANYVVNVVNMIRNRQLQTIAQQGRMQLKAMQENVEELEVHVNTLNSEVAVQKVIADRLKGNLEATRNLLESSIVEYRTEMARQRELLSQQNVTLSRITRSKFNQDLILDSSLLAAAVYAVNTSLIHYPVNWMAALISRSASPAVQRSRARFMKQFTKAVLVLYLTQKLRSTATHYGLHNQVGSAAGYVASMMTSFISMASSTSRLLISPFNTSEPKDHQLALVTKGST
eukprot:Partr_v1_DN28443_c1_g1_i3_m42252 putative NA